jgi:Spy/CpxP family protein refolding chaperone
MTQVSAGGDWAETVDVRCVAADAAPPPGWAPWMQGRGAVRLGERVKQLRETLAERQQVLAAIRAGRRGPFEFERTVWKVVDLFAGGDSSGPS